MKNTNHMNPHNRRIIIFGTGDFANQVSFYFKNDTNFEIVAYTIDAEFNRGSVFLGLPVINFEEIQIHYPPEEYDMFVAVGYKDLNKSRETKFLEAKSKGYHLISYVCSKNIVWNDLELGENCFIMEGNVIQYSVRILDNVIIGIGNHFGHNVIIEENCFLTSGVTIGGFSKICRNCFIGLNASIRDKIIIEENNILGVGSVLLKSTKKDSVYLTSSTIQTKVDNRLIMKLI